MKLFKCDKCLTEIETLEPLKGTVAVKGIAYTVFVNAVTPNEMNIHFCHRCLQEAFLPVKYLYSHDLEAMMKTTCPSNLGDLTAKINTFFNP